MAVVIVALDHARVPFLHGGYVGVDVFFVLSGFLITRLLLADARTHRRVRLGNFYARRARRILPAATLTLALTTVAGFVLLNTVRAKQISWDSFWAALFAANIRFAHQGTDYFAQSQPPSAVQHYWSLAVEEQFYLVWPAVISVVLFGVLLGRRIVPGRVGHHFPPRNERSWARRLLLVALCGGAASLFWSIHFTDTLPAAAYFSTRARAWELALGAALAVTEGKLTHLPATLRHAAGWLGLVAIAAATFTFTSSTAFPGFAALVPTIGAALVILAGIGDDVSRGAGRLLAITPMRYVGDRSYAFYLWHWPVLIIASLYVDHQLEVGMNLLLLLGAFALSVVSYRLVENRIRHARWGVRPSLVFAPASLAAVLALTLGTVAWIDANAPSLQISNAAAATAAVRQIRLASTASGPARALPSVAAAVRAAERGAPIPPNLDPPPADFLQDAYQFPSGCAPQSETETSSTICRLGDATASKSIVLVGDSHAQMWMPTVLAMARSDGWVVTPLAKSGCVVSAWVGQGYPGTPKSTVSRCHAWFRWAKRQLRALHPDVTLMAGCCGGASGSTLAAMKAGIVSLAAAAKPVSKSVIFVSDDDGIAKDPTDCLLARHATLKTCLTTWTSDQFAGNDALARVAASHGFGFMQTRGWFCDGFRCPMVVGRTVVYRDAGHITQAYALRLAVPFRAAFRRCIFGSCP